MYVAYRNDIHDGEDLFRGTSQIHILWLLFTLHNNSFEDPVTIMASTGGKLIVNSALRAAMHVNSSQLPSEFIRSSAAFLSAAPSGGKFTLPDLPYDYAALEREF